MNNGEIISSFLRQVCTHDSARYSLRIENNVLLSYGAPVAVVPAQGYKGHNTRVGTAPTNFRNVIALFAARKLVTETWVNQKDEWTTQATSAWWVLSQGELERWWYDGIEFDEVVE